MKACLLQASLAVLGLVALALPVQAGEPPTKVAADQASPDQWPAMAEAGDPLAQALLARAYPDSSVDYQVADLFDHPRDWTRGFDLVFECNTIQALPGEFRVRALNAIAELVAPGGTVLVSCRSRQAGEKENEFPLPLERAEIDGFVRAGLREDAFVAYDDNQDPPVPHFFACYGRQIKAGA